MARTSSRPSASWILAVGLILMLGNLIRAFFAGTKSPVKPWEAATLEWQTTLPPPVENFEDQPVVTKGPYEFR